MEDKINTYISIAQFNEKWGLKPSKSYRLRLSKGLITTERLISPQIQLEWEQKLGLRIDNRS
jgi:hypothetical protein